jgi:hypothetical protein
MPPGVLELPGKDLVVDEYLSFENIQNKKISYCKACTNMCRIMNSVTFVWRWGNVEQV